MRVRDVVRERLEGNGRNEGARRTKSTSPLSRGNVREERQNSGDIF
jgi:hypothetical protein